MTGAQNSLQVGAITIRETRALKALAKGEATPEQQKLALEAIIFKFSGFGDVPFVPGAPDESAFMSGRQFVGNRINRHLRQTVAALHPNEEEDGSE